MKRTLLFGFLIFVFASCQQSKKYEYIEIVTNKSRYRDIERTKKEEIIIKN